ncbi:Ulp1 protease family, C-terminal catalytic domain-containing protein [Carex littledalei]|uniref:Ulp1 protease family, C-terminal catalytic domain-containing protein n=1 Tax=Carex littledalei TaxID=544730 RepID=A0A833QQH8_9POAL|nr:Ulp1 protease family, C-terminal catalytic domain-containing protein [Carex littledalei]
MAAVEYVRNVESSTEVVKMNGAFGILILTAGDMNCLIQPTYETGHSKWINDERNGIQFLISLALDTDNLLRTKYSDLDITKWPMVVTKVPQQKDDHLCGLFALKFIELWKGCNEFSMSLKVDDEDAELFRKRLVYQLIINEKNTLEKVQKDIWDRVLSLEEYK